MVGQESLFPEPKQFDQDPPSRRKPRKDIPGQRYIVGHRDLTQSTCGACGASLALLELSEGKSVWLDMDKYQHGTAPVHTDVCPKRVKK